MIRVGGGKISDVILRHRKSRSLRAGIFLDRENLLYVLFHLTNIQILARTFHRLMQLLLKLLYLTDCRKSYCIAHARHDAHVSFLKSVGYQRCRMRKR